MKERLNVLTSSERIATPGLMLILLILPFSAAFATGGVMTGSGSAADPYIVTDYADLKAVGTTYGMNMVYRLGADIDASASKTENGGAGFPPIGSSSSLFTGAFHGAGHVIRNLTIKRAGASYVGFIAYSRGTVDSLGMVDAYVSAHNFVGTIVGSNEGSVTRCYATGTVIGLGGGAGGLVGNNSGYSTPGLMNGCYASVAVSGGNGIGGLAGYQYYGTLTNSYATGSVTASSSSAGGLLGYCYVGVFNNCFATGPVTGTTSVGGLVGMICFYSERIVSGCYATGSVSGTGDNVGGLVGLNYGGNQGTLTACYSTGTVVGTGSKVGALIGYNQTTTVGGCYWNSQTSGWATGIGTNSGTATVTGLTSAQMRQAANYPGWNFSSVWTIRPDSTYPGLRSLDNAPFGFADTIATARIFPLSRLLENDCDVETARQNLLLRVLNLTQGATDSTTTLTFPAPIARGAVSTVRYRIGEARSADTLWGNVASAVLSYTLMEGRGTAEDPYLVENYDDLKSVGVTYGLDKVYRLVADIDASASLHEHGDSGFVRIGARLSPFTGKFHGAGHLIKNLTINRPAQDTVGLFGAITGGTVDSLGLVALSITGKSCVGGLLGFGSNDTIRACYASGFVRGNGWYTGGLVGYSVSGRITGSYSTGDVASTGSLVGGLIGYNINAYVGECYATGSVAGQTSSGGLIGYNLGSVSESYATGSVQGTNNSEGGFVGTNEGSIRRCYSTGTASGGTTVGGFVAVNGPSGTISASYWDRTASGLMTGVGTNNGSVAVTGLTTREMRNAGNFSTWAFDTTWTIRTDSTYPGLRSLENAPFAFDDTVQTGGSFPLSDLLANDCDIETAQNDLHLRLLSVDLGSIDENGAFSFPDTALLGTVARIRYRLGGTGLPDTLWGNIATAVVVRTLPGRGTPEEPYLVEKYSELKMVGAGYGFDRVYRLIADIDASASATEHGDSGFIPIGSIYQPFTGVFHGGGHVIRGVRINQPAADNMGFFGSLCSGTIDSVGLVNISVRGRNVVGALVGNDSGAVLGCYATGSVQGNAYVGGLAGYAYAGRMIVHSYSTCSVTASGSGAGGLAGNNSGTVDESYASGPVSAVSSAGGLIGVNRGTVTRSYATGPVRSSSGNLGALVGGSYSGTIADCYATGRLSGEGNSGGIVGYNASGSWVGRSYWDTLSTGLATGVGSNLGGAEITGSASAEMKRSGTFAAWDFDSTWTIRTDSTYPGLAHLENTPVAFADTIASVTRTVDLSRLLLNDGDIERGVLTLRVATITEGTTDSAATLVFADTAANLTVSLLTYRVGEIRGVDTLWGNHASAIITLDTVVVGVQDGGTVPLAFGLKQNYPNPFNPSTTISYALPRSARVSLTVYNTLGEKVALLVDEEQGAGEYLARFDGRTLASGVYFYSLRAGDFVQTRKLLLVK